MKIDFKEVREKGLKLVTIEGEIDVYTSIELRNEIKTVIDEGSKLLIMDLGKVTYMDSSGLGTLVSILQRLKKEEGSLKLIKVTTNIKKIFELTRLTRYFEMFDSEEECIKSFD